MEFLRRVYGGEKQLLLDFLTGTYAHEIRYRLHDLNLDRPVSISQDNRLKLFTTYLDGGGEAMWGDYVILNMQTQEIWYLSHFDLHDVAFFIGPDRVFITRCNNMEILGAHAGNPLLGAPEFDFGQSEQIVDRTRYMVAVFDRTGKQVDIIDSEIGKLFSLPDIILMEIFFGSLS